MIAAGALVAWVLVLFFGWAIQPIDDTVPVEVDPTSELATILANQPELTPIEAERAQAVQCNSLFASSPRDTAVPLPELPPDYVYARVPCVSPHSGAQLAAIVNVLAVVALVIGWVSISRRFRIEDGVIEPQPEQQPTTSPT